MVKLLLWMEVDSIMAMLTNITQCGENKEKAT